MATLFTTRLPAHSALTLQICAQCQQVNYPPRELCGNCLADELQWHTVQDSGVVQAMVQLHYSLEPVYAQHLPWAVASVKLDCGPVVLAHLQPGIDSGSAITLKVIQDEAGNRMLVATGKDSASQRSASAWLDTVDFREVAT